LAICGNLPSVLYATLYAPADDPAYVFFSCVDGAVVPLVGVNSSTNGWFGQVPQDLLVAPGAPPMFLNMTCGTGLDGHENYFFQAWMGSDNGSGTFQIAYDLVSCNPFHAEFTIRPPNAFEYEVCVPGSENDLLGVTVTE
jgi:hypothetical protein